MEEQAAHTEPRRKADSDRRGAWVAVPVAVVILLVFLLLLSQCARSGTDGVSEIGGTGAETLTAVPNVIGMPVSSATPLLATADLRISVQTSTAAEPEDQMIVDQRPTAGTRVPKDATVTVLVIADEPVVPEPFVPTGEYGTSVSGPRQVDGYGTVTVPDVVGLSPSAAADRARSAGLEPTPLRRPPRPTGPLRVVFSQFPPPGQHVRRGSELTYSYREP